MSGPLFAMLDGTRAHFQHGPIDLVIEAKGEAEAVRLAYERAWLRFQRLLEVLSDELSLLRSQVAQAQPVSGPVARRMFNACWPYREVFITPMAAVAGAVSDEVLDALVDGDIRKAYVNNGGDIALHLGPGEVFKVGVAEGFEKMAGHISVGANAGIGGVATSGWRGRSFSLGIADSVTVLAVNAAAADAAATIIANAVNVDDAVIARKPACSIKDDSDLGERLVTTAVGPLSPEKIDKALDRGHAKAKELIAAGLVRGAALFLQERVRMLAPERALRAGASTELAHS